MPTIITRGGMSAQGFGFGATVTGPLYVEDVFSTWLYTGNGSNQTITNGIDLAGKGGLVWIKARSSAQNNVLADTANGTSLWLSSNTTDGQSGGSVVTAFSSTGFNTGGNTNYVAGNGVTYASWTFREAANFFDVVTYTGNGSTQNIAHNLGVAPGTIIVKRTDAGAGWRVYHRSQPNGYGDISSTDAFYTNSAERVFGNGSTVVAPTSTDFTIGDATSINGSGATFVAYLFAHDTSSTGIIQCGSYTGTSAAGNAQNLGWEPQWLMVKSASGVGDWFMLDNMRGIPTGGNDACLLANSSIAEFANADRINLTSTGFEFGGSDLNNSGTSYIYIAIRRGPMRTPTSGTSVFSPNLETANAPWFKSGFATDMGIYGQRTGPSSNKFYVGGRLTGTAVMNSRLTDAEFSDSSYKFDYMTGWNSNAFNDGSIWIGWSFRRAPSFFDEVCYTGTGVARTINHNLGVAPELMIVRNRSTGNIWPVYAAPIGQRVMQLNSNAASFASTYWNSTDPTSTVFSVGASTPVNASGVTFVAYLFASCPGVSKVGSYTGTGALQTINCGFTTGARFVLIKRTDSTGDWYVWDSARGIVAGDDPYLLLNSTAAEVTNTDYVDTDNSGFQVTAAAPAGINANGGSYIFLAVA